MRNISVLFLGNVTLNAFSPKLIKKRKEKASLFLKTKQKKKTKIKDC